MVGSIGLIYKYSYRASHLKVSHSQILSLSSSIHLLKRTMLTDIDLPIESRKRPRRKKSSQKTSNEVSSSSTSSTSCESSGSDNDTGPTGPVSICWYRSHDLRIADHAALRAASEHGAVVPAFIWPNRRGEWSLGGAAEAWQRAVLASLDTDFRNKYNSRLVLRLAGSSTLALSADITKVSNPRAPPPTASGIAEAVDTASALVRLAKDCGATAVFFSKGYEPELEYTETVVTRVLREAGIQCTGHAGHLLYEPKDIYMPGGFNTGHWGTLMPFVRACEKSGPRPAEALPAPDALRRPRTWPHSEVLQTLRLAAPPVRKDGSEGPDWGAAMIAEGDWVVTEAAAHRSMHTFVNGAGLKGYENRRSRADEPGAVSRLSAYLRFGQLSPRQLYHATRDAGLEREQIKVFSRRLHWRDLAYYQLHCFPDMATYPIRRHYVGHAWSDNSVALRAWQLGRTGYPMVDAGMRCLYATGWLHQSVRMIVASFLIEYMGVHWVEGVKWFHDVLVDADLAINTMMWQNAGRSGIDQWNFVLSPVNASQDPSGKFCRRWLPELARLPNKYLHAPWTAHASELSAAGVVLGHTYPHRIIENLEASRRITVKRCRENRAANLEYNDSGGYDLIRLPDGVLTKVFTKQEFRLDGRGELKAYEPKYSQGARAGASGGAGRGGAGASGGAISGVGGVGGGGGGRGTASASKKKKSSGKQPKIDWYINPDAGKVTM